MDVHAHTGDLGGMPMVEGSRVFGQTISPAQWDEVTETLQIDGLYWGLGLHPIMTNAGSEVEGLLDRLPDCVAVGEVGLDNTGHAPISMAEQREVLIAILTHPEAQKRLVSLHALLCYGDLVSLLAEYPTPGAILHWWCWPGEPLEESIEQDLFYSVNDAVAAIPDQAVVLPDLPRTRVLIETDSPYVDRETGQPLNPWEGTDDERAAGRGLVSGEVLPMERSLAKLWGVDTDEVRWQLWRNLAELESRVEVRPFGAAEVLRVAGYEESFD
jgi:TatD DNase family protein